MNENNRYESTKKLMKSIACWWNSNQIEKKHIQTDITLQTETEWDAPMNPNWKKKIGEKKAIPNVFGLIESNEE